MSQSFAKPVPLDTDPTLASDSDYVAPSQSAVKSYVDNQISAIENPNHQTILTVSGSLTVASNPLRVYNKLGVSQTISEVFIAVNTAPTGANVIVDVNKNGTTIFTNQANRPEIAASANTDSTVSIDVATWAAGEYLTIDVDQIGSALPGSDLVVHIISN